MPENEEVKKMKITRRMLICTLLLCNMLWFTLPQSTNADDSIMPLDLYVDTLSVSGKIDVVSGKLSYGVNIKTSEKCEIYITSTVYKYVDGNWQYYTSFRNPSSGTYVGQSKLYENSCKVEKGYNYKVIVTAHVTSVADQISEDISQSSNILSYK